MCLCETTGGQSWERLFVFSVITYTCVCSVCWCLGDICVLCLLVCLCVCVLVCAIGCEVGGVFVFCCDRASLSLRL